MTKSAQDLAKERGLRIAKALNLEEPDRVPYFGIAGDIIASYGGINQYEYCHDYDKTVKATLKFLKDFPCDTAMAGIPGIWNMPLAMAMADYPEIPPIVYSMTGPMHDILQDRYTRFPGRELSVDSSPQFWGGTFMEVNEYEELAQDPIKFSAEKILPRTCRNLEKPGTSEYMATMFKLGMEAKRLGAFMQELFQGMAALGYPLTPSSFAYSPLDYIGDCLRNIDSVVLDLRRYPNQVKAACEALVEPIVKMALSLKPVGANMAFIPLHLNEYLSPKLYQEFYWPPLKKVILRLLDEGLKSFVFFEGHHEAHLETILELPKGWGMAYFEKTDVVKAKEVLKGHTCVVGGIPISLLISGTPAEIDEYMKNLLEKVKPGGGFILGASVANAPENTPLENLKAVIDAVEKYGWY